MTRELYKLRIEAYSPDTMPMAQLAAYLADLANILGHEDRVHFVELESGSTVIVHAVEKEAAPKVCDRVRDIRNQDAPQDALKAYRELDKRLEKDNASAVLIAPDNSHVIEFPGRNKPRPLVYGPLNQMGHLDGVLIRIGGEEQQVPVHLEEEPGKIHICQANRDIARLLAPYIFGPHLRVSGEGRWLRTGEGTWEMKRFTIKTFDVLRDDTLADALTRMRSVDSPLRTMKDPLAELKKIRHG